MNIKLAIMTVSVLVFVAGCGTTKSVIKSPASSAATNASTTHTTSGSSTQVDPALYLTCVKIYNGVSLAAQDKNSGSFDADLESITKTAQNSPQSSPNAILFDDANTLVAMDDALNGDGQPAHLYDALDKALKKMAQDLKTYKPNGN